MKDRIPQNPGRVLVKPENGGAEFYAILERADNPIQEGDALNKANLLTDETAFLLGLSADAVPDDAFGAIAEGKANNSNLIDNWYFADPVNQRGLTEYTGTVYGIDRWRGESDQTVVTVGDGHISIAGVDGIGYLRHYIDNPSSCLGKNITISILYADGTFRTNTGQMPDAVPTSSQTIVTTPTYDSTYISVALYYTGRLYAQFRVSTGHSSEIVAVKLELGSVQTLVHQDADGNWVLNDPPPNKQIETLKCCMSKADSADTYANNNYTHAAVGSAKAVIGSYTGTGVGGTEENANSLTFDEVPKIVIMLGYKSSVNTYYAFKSFLDDAWNFAMIPALLTTTYVSEIGFGHSGSSYRNYGKRSEDGKTLYWYVNWGGESTTGSYQYNVSGFTYYYLAIF